MDVHPTKNGINMYWSIPIWNDAPVLGDSELHGPEKGTGGCTNTTGGCTGRKLSFGPSPCRPPGSQNSWAWAWSAKIDGSWYIYICVCVIDIWWTYDGYMMCIYIYIYMMDLLSLSLSLSIAISEMDLRSCSIFNREGDDLCHGMESRPNFEKGQKRASSMTLCHYFCPLALKDQQNQPMNHAIFYIFSKNPPKTTILCLQSTLQIANHI